MVLTVTEDTPADMLAGSMELLVQLPRDHNVHTQRVTVPRSTPMMDLLVQIATAHKLSASSYTLQAIGERGLVLPHQPNTPIGALDALQVKLLPKQGTFMPRKAKQANQPFETTFRLQVLLPRNQLYVSRVSPKMNLGKILEEVCREKNLDKNKYELRHPANLEETLDLSLSLQDYHLQEVTLYAKQERTMGAALSSQDIMALQRQEERRRQQAKQSVFGFMFRKSKDSSLSIDSLGGRSVSPARSDETGRSVSPLAPPSRPQRKRRPAPKPPVKITSINRENDDDNDESKEKLVISHSRNSSDSSGYHEASVLSDNPDSSARMPETLPRRSKPPCKIETSRKLAQTSQASKSLGNLAMASGGLSHGISSTSISSTGVRKKRAAPPPPIARPLSSAISSQALERIIDSEESLTSDIDISKSPSDIATSSKANSDIGVSSKANSDIGVHSMGSKPSSEIGYKIDAEFRAALANHDDKSMDIDRNSSTISSSSIFKPIVDVHANINDQESDIVTSLDKATIVEKPRIAKRETRALAPTPKPRSAIRACETPLPVASKRNVHASMGIDITSDPIEASIESKDDAYNDESQKMKKEDSELVDVIGLRENNDESVDCSAIKKEKSKISSMINFEGENNLENHVLKHAKSMDNIYFQSMEFPQKNIDEDDNSLSSIPSCAVISTIPKCAHLKLNMEKNKFGDEQDIQHNIKFNDSGISSHLKDDPDVKMTKFSIQKKPKIFRSQSAFDDFEVNSLDKKMRHLTSHTEDFNCALNPNLSRSVMSFQVDKNIDGNKEIEVSQIETDSRLRKRVVDNFPPFVLSTTNIGYQEDLKMTKIEDNWEPQLIEQSGNGDRPTETDILLQKVSDTLSNSLPTYEPPQKRDIEATINTEKIMKNHSIDKNEPDGIHEIFEISNKTKDSKGTINDKKNHDTILTMRHNVACSPDATLNSQQDTSDYVSATGDDLSITDWEYQLPAPPSAFRDNISPDFDGYDTITLRSIEAFKEPSIDNTDHEKISINDLSSSQSPILPSKEIVRETNVIPDTTIEKNIERTFQEEKPKSTHQSSSEIRKFDVNSELKKEIISELSTKIESGSLSQTNGKFNDQDCRRTIIESSEPKIAPVDNTLSNFTITTYSRQKSLNIFEDEPLEEKRNMPKFTNSSSKSQKSETSTINKDNDREKFGNSLNRHENNFRKEEKLFVEKELSNEHVSRPEVEFKKIEGKVHFNQNDSLLRHSSFNGGLEKSTNVHRSKSYITLANNSKYREDVEGERPNENFRNEHDNGRMIKSTSVTNLNHEGTRNNEKFSQWRDNILKKQEEPSKEKQLQSIQVLKNILPRLKNNQQTEENVTDWSDNGEYSNPTGRKTVPGTESIESKSTVQETRRETEPTKPQKNTEDTTTTTKRYKYTGPPAINLGSWAERPRVNVQLKMDTDYKFAANNNTSGSKTCVNLNGTINERNENKQQIKQTTLPRNFLKNSTTNGTVTSEENKPERRESENESSKKLTMSLKKPVLNRFISSEAKKTLTNDNEKPIVTSVALKKNCIEKSEARINDREELTINDEDDVKIDTKPVNFRELSKTFGQEVCLRTKPKRVLQNRHSDYYGGRTDIAQNLSNTNNGQTNFWDNANKNTIKQTDSLRNNVSNGIQNHGNVKRYTSIIGIQSHHNNNNATDNGETKNFVTSTRVNGLMPVVKGFKISTNQNEAIFADSRIRENGISRVDSLKKVANFSSPTPPPPPTMPIITGVTLKNSTARPKSMPVCNIDPRDQLLESIRNFGGRDRLKSVQS